MRRLAMVFGFPVVAIVAAYGIVYWVMVVGPIRDQREKIAAYEAAHPEFHRAEVELDGALARLLGPADDWAAAGLPRHHQNGSNHGYITETTAFETHRHFPNEAGGLPMFGATLRINTPDGLRKEGAMAIMDGVSRVHVAEGRIGAQPGPVGSWRVVCRRPRRSPGITRDLFGECVCGGAWVRVELEGDVTPAQVAGFEALIRAMAGRMPDACAAELAPYIAEMNARRTESR